MLSIFRKTRKMHSDYNIQRAFLIHLRFFFNTHQSLEELEAQKLQLNSIVGDSPASPDVQRKTETRTKST